MSSKPVGRNPKRNPSTKVLGQSSNKGMIVTVLVLLAVAVLVLGGVVWFAKKDTGSSPVALGQTADPQITLTDEGVVGVGKADAPAKLDIYEDFMCPACGSLEKAYGAQISQAVEDGKLHVDYHMLNFLDRSSGSGTYSTRALAAVQCVAQHEKLKTLVDVKSAFFANQPAEGGGDRTTDELATTAGQAGAGDESVNCIKGIEDNGSIDTAKKTADASTASLRKVADKLSTPTVVHDGKQVEISDKQWLDKVLAGK